MQFGIYKLGLPPEAKFSPISVKDFTYLRQKVEEGQDLHLGFLVPVITVHFRLSPALQKQMLGLHDSQHCPPFRCFSDRHYSTHVM